MLQLPGSFALAFFLLQFASSLRAQSIHEAAAAGDTAAIRSYAQSGSDLNAPDANGFSPLQIATRNRHKTAVEMTSLGYLVQVDGLVIYYAGFRAEDLEDYTQALEFLSDRVDRVDMAFLPLIETDEADSDYKVFFEKLNPRAVFVLDPNRKEEEYGRMRDKASGWGFEPEVFTAENPGDAFVFKRR